MRWLGVVLVLGCKVAVAAEPGPAADPGALAAARALYAEGERAYEAGHYRDAAQQFDAAYAIQPLPALLFNGAQAWYHDFERTADHASAQHAAVLYRRFLATAEVTAADRTEAAAQLAHLEQEVPEVALTARPADKPATSRRGLWIGLGVGAAVVVAALAIGLGVGLSAANGPTVVARW
jgi:hypothetical protein